CDPDYLNCGDNISTASRVIFEENFDGVTSNTTLNSRGWTNINVSGGEKKFTPTLSSGNRILRISAYNTIESPLEAWLVTPEFDLTDSQNEVLVFDLLSSYDNGLLLSVYVSQNFTGDPRTTEWIPVDANIPLGPSGANSTIFRESRIDISCLEGEVWIGFRYLGSAPDKTTTYELDNVRLLAD
ncbi:MAG: choice-of-anchor J domain-containing protein, partial [Christiangramia sp.]|nr:choice-of-anchor J domain-containing protein [Christiangramia sp.]